MFVDTSGDGLADSVHLDTDGDGRPDTIVPAAGTAGMLVDTSGDGLADSVHVDTSGDGRPDTFVPLRESYATAAAVVRAVNLARKASKREKTPVDDAAEEWSAHAWVDSMTQINKVIGDGLLQPLLREVRPDGAPEAVNLTLHDGEGRQALHLAAENGHAECVRMLVMAGGAAHANARVAGGEQGHALKGRTALMMACDKGHEKVVRVLLHTEKLDLDAKCDDENGPKTAEDYARAHSETKHLAALIEAKRKERAQKEGPGSP